ncbi:cullin-5-like, partial [Tropilaelaps mercedesae]
AERTLDSYDEKSIIRELIISAWNSIVLKPLGKKLSVTAINIINAERIGQPTHTDLVISTRNNLLDFVPNTASRLDVYEKHLEKPYLHKLKNTYATQAPAYMAQHGVLKYLQYADQKWTEEEVRGRKYLDDSASTLAKLRQCLTKELVQEHIAAMHAECSALVRNGNTKLLAVMFRLLDHTRFFDPIDIQNSIHAAAEALSPMVKCISDYVIEKGHEEMRANLSTIADSPQNFVAMLVEIYRVATNFICDIAGNDARFTCARDQAFKKVINDHSIFSIKLPEGRRSKKTALESRCPEFLAICCDSLLKKSNVVKKLTADEIKRKLEEITKLSLLLNNKDVFLNCYKRCLTRRLITSASHDTDLETFMIEALRDAGMAADDINAMRRMFLDIERSADVSKKFNASLSEKNTGSGVTRGLVDMKILTQGGWRCIRDERLPMTLPLELEGLVPQLESFYKKEHQNKVLHWQHHLSNGVVTFRSERGIYDLEVTTIQLAVLFAWNERPYVNLIRDVFELCRSLRLQEKIPLEDIHLSTDLPETELRWALVSLVNCSKLKIQVLCCDQPDYKLPNNFTTQTKFWVNHNFHILKDEKVRHRGSVNLVPRAFIGEKSIDENSNDIAYLRANRTEVSGRPV